MYDTLLGHVRPLGIATKRHKTHKMYFDFLALFCAFLWPFPFHPARYSQMLSTAFSSSTPLARTPTFEPYAAESNRMLRMLRASASRELVESDRNKTILDSNFEESWTSFAAALA